MSFFYLLGFSKLSNFCHKTRKITPIISDYLNKSVIFLIITELVKDFKKKLLKIIFLSKVNNLFQSLNVFIKFWLLTWILSQNNSFSNQCGENNTSPLD